jgi:hypothetical protein
MTKLQSIIVAIMMTTLIFLGLDGEGYIHKGALFLAGSMFALLFLAAWMEWEGQD